DPARPEGGRRAARGTDPAGWAGARAGGGQAVTRYALLGLVVLGLVLPLTLAADDPPAGQDEPPVRLKKKERPGAPKDDPMKKPDPEKNPEPDKKPDPDKKPEAKEDPPPAEPAEGEEEILERLLKNTKKAQDRLANREVDEGTRQLQRDILKDIEALIKKSESDQGGGG